MRTNSRLLLWMLFFAAFAPRSFAVLMDPLSIEQLAERSSVILRGTVLAKSCQRDPAGRIYTKVELDVAEVWKGSLSAQRFTIVHGGGILGEKRVIASGQAEYGIGEEVVAFLVLNQRGEGVTLGLMQGKFRVWKDAKTGEPLAQNPFHGGEVPIANTGGPAMPLTRPSGTLRMNRKVGRVSPSTPPSAPTNGAMRTWRPTDPAGSAAQGAVEVRGVLTLAELKRRVQRASQTATSDKAGGMR